MTQIIGDAKHIKGKPLSGDLASGQVWEYNGTCLVPAAGPGAVGSMASYASGVVAGISDHSGLALVSGGNLIPFQGDPLSGLVLKLSGTDVLRDLYWGPDETASGGGGYMYRFIDVDSLTTLDANSTQDTLHVSGRSGVKLSAVSGSASGADQLFIEVFGLTAAQIPNWATISGMAAAGSGIAVGTSGVAVGASGIAAGGSGIAAGGSGIAGAASGIAVGGSGQGAYASGVVAAASGTSGFVMSSGANFITLIPAGAPASGMTLKWSGANVLAHAYWSATSVAGSNGDLLFNSGGDVGAYSGLFFDSTNKRLGVGTGSPGAGLDVVIPGAASSEKALRVINSGSGNGVELFQSGVNCLNLVGSGVFLCGNPAATASVTGMAPFEIQCSGVSGDGRYGQLALIDLREYSTGGVGGGICFGGKYTGSAYAVGGFIRAAKRNSTVGDAAFDLAFGTRPVSTPAVERMRIFHDGSVAIGKTTAGYTLDVSGSIGADAAVYAGDTYIHGSGMALNLSGSGNRTAYVDLIGDDTYTDYGLRLIRNNTGTNAISNIVHRGTGRFEIQCTESANIYLNNGGGMVGIGTLPTAAKLHISSTLAAGGSDAGIFMSATVPAADSTARYGVKTQLWSSHPSGNCAWQVAYAALVGCSGASGATTTSATCQYARVDVYSGHTTTNTHGFYAAQTALPGTVTNQYGFYCTSLTSGVSGNYAVYTAGATQSYFGGVVTHAANVMPAVSTAYDLGSSSAAWRDVYTHDGSVHTSDENRKESIADLDHGLDFISLLRPRKFKWKDFTYEKQVPLPTRYGTDGKALPEEYGTETVEVRHRRTHFGLVAQEVMAALETLGLTTNDFAGYIRDSSGNQGLRYHELIPILIKSIQELNARLVLLEGHA